MKQTDPIVSIIIPAYNGQDTIARAIESALNQTLKEVEVIVVDDGSTDGTQQVLKRYEGRIIHVRQANKGVSGARNTGIAHSHGRYLCFLDQDDTLMRRKAELQADLLDARPEAGLCYGVCQWIDSRNGKPFMSQQVGTDKLDRSCAPFPPRFQIGAAMMRRDWLDWVEGFCEEFKEADDTDLLFRLWAAGCQFVPINVVVSTWTARPGSMSRPNMWIEDLKALERHFVSMGDAIDEPFRNRLRVRGLLKIGALELLAGHMQKTRALWGKAFTLKADLLQEVRTWSGVLSWLNPCDPLPDPRAVLYLGQTWRSLSELIESIALREEQDGAHPGTNVRQAKSLLAFALSRVAFFRRKSWLARWWLARSFIMGVNPSPILAQWRIMAKIVIGITLCRLASWLLRFFRDRSNQRKARASEIT